MHGIERTHLREVPAASDRLRDVEIASGPLALTDVHSHLASFVRRLEAEDMSFVIGRLVTREGMERDLALKARIGFIQYMALIKAGHRTAVPSTNVDAFWHAYILHTKQYAAFCQAHFGHFLHHDPFEHGGALKAGSLVGEVFQNVDEAVWNSDAMCSNSNCEPWISPAL